MFALSESFSMSGYRKRSGTFAVLLLILLILFVFGRPAEARTSIYVFVPGQSTLVQTGGIAGVHETYGIEGKFRLTVDFDAGIASFEQVDANLTEPTGFLYSQGLGEIFNMAGLAGTIVDGTTIQFEGKTADGTESDVSLTLTFEDDSARLTGKTTLPPNSADMFLYELEAVATKKYAGGTGEPNNPYLIYTAEQMNEIGPNLDVDSDRHFKLMADIDLSNYTGTDFNIIGVGWDSRFTGVFDGNGHTISNFTYVSPEADRSGLFGYVWGAEIKDLGLIDPDVDAGTGRFVGLLVGQIIKGTISGCFVQGGTITGGEVVGGLVGYNDATIINCYANGNVTGLECLGGLVGCNEGGTISACYSTGSVSGEGIIGGLAGQNGNYYSRREGVSISGYIDNCYSTCDVNGVIDVGGLVGFNHVGSITRCYSRGGVMGVERAGGLVGEDHARITECFWDMETSGLTHSAGGSGKTTAEMQMAGTFLDAGWDFVDEIENGTEDIWWILEGQDYPQLWWKLVEDESGAFAENLPAGQ